MVLPLFALLVPQQAQAHLSGLALNDFWQGVLHPLTTLETALAILALGMLAGQAGEHKGLRVIGTFALLLVTGAVAAVHGVNGPWVGWANLASLLVLGLLVALALTPPLAVLVGLAAIFGLTHGIANGLEIVAPVKAWLFILGLAVGAYFALLYVLIGVVGLQPWWTRIGVRVVGSWIAAVGLLLVALDSLRKISV